MRAGFWATPSLLPPSPPSARATTLTVTSPRLAASSPSTALKHRSLSSPWNSRTFRASSDVGTGRSNPRSRSHLGLEDLQTKVRRVVWFSVTSQKILGTPTLSPTASRTLTEIRPPTPGIRIPLIHRPISMGTALGLTMCCSTVFSKVLLSQSESPGRSVSAMLKGSSRRSIVGRSENPTFTVEMPGRRLVNLMHATNSASKAM